MSEPLMRIGAAAPPVDASFADLALPAMGRPVSGRRWVLRGYSATTAAAIAEETDCAPLLARLLAARGVKAGEARDYLNPSLRKGLPDPSVLADMDVAAARISQAIINGERCGVFGDYDVDGTCAAAILKGYFSALDAPLDVYLPDRILEGYGPSIAAFRALKDGGARLVMTVDCGAAAHEAISAAAKDGLSVIVLDHHQMDGPPPAGAFATVNPNRPDDRSSLKTLSAAGVAFMTVVAVNRALRAAGFFATRSEPDVRRFLDLAALGLVCDVMPMTGAARLLTAHGLRALNAGGNPGLAALGARAGLKAPATSYDLGFLLGPRINAAGRIGHARLAFDLLTTDDPARRAMLAEKLHVMNAERQEVESAVLREAIRVIDGSRGGEGPVVVAAGEGWHPGVIGIVAGRLKDRYERPTFVIGIENGVGKGSARSIAGVDIGALVRRARDEGLLIAGGGHAMAAGLTIAAEAIPAFTAYLTEACREAVDRALLTWVRDVDALIAPTAVSGAMAGMIAQAGPFGPENPEPVFAIASMRVERAKPVGTGHLACELASAVGERVRAIAFRAVGEPLGDLLATKSRLHLAGRVKPDDWRGGDAAQFHIVDAAEDVG